MNIHTEEMANQAVIILKNSSLQFFCFIGCLVVSGFFLSFLSRWTNNSLRQFRFPQFGLYFFGIIGIPIHELSHAVFAKVFFHKIKSIKWFDPSGRGGSHGTVVHYYNDKNLYHRIGLFFIGVGPVLLAPVILYAAYKGLVPEASRINFTILNPGYSIELFVNSILHSRNWGSLGFYLFLYLTICLTSQMELSPDDIKIASGGLFPLFSIIVLVNLMALFFGYDLHRKLVQSAQAIFLLWGGFVLFAIVISIINLIFCYCFLNLLNRMMGSHSINPFKD